MKRTKKILGLVLIVAMLFSLSSTAFATEIASANNETQAVETAVENYLTERMRGIYFHEDAELLPLTINSEEVANSLSLQSELENICDTVSVARQESAMVLSNNTEMETATSVLDTMSANIQLDAELTEFFGHVYESQNIGYTYFDAEYVFDNTEIDGDTAAITVYECLNYQYDNCDEPSSEVVKYDVIAIRIGDTWRIAYVYSDDVAINSLYNVGFDLEKSIELFDITYEESQVELALYNNVELEMEPSTENALSVMATSSNITYNGQNAANYALTYSTSSDNNSYGYPTEYNTNFFWFGADCMNYASQCVWAGFGGSNSSNDINNYRGMDRNSSSIADTTWWCRASGGTSSWASCSAFRNYLDNNGTSDGIQALQTEIGPDDGMIYLSKNQLIGSVIHVRGKNGTRNVQYGHALIVNNALGETFNNRSTIYYCAYNAQQKNILLNNKFPIYSAQDDFDEEFCGLWIITPTSMVGANSSDRIWADLHNAILLSDAQANGVTLKAYGNKAWATMSFEVFSPTGSSIKYTFSNKSSITQTSSYFTSTGLWTVVVTGTDSAGATSSFTYIVRIA